MATALSLLPDPSIPSAPFQLHPTPATGRRKSRFLCPAWPRNYKTAERKKIFLSLHVVELNQIHIQREWRPGWTAHVWAVVLHPPQCRSAQSGDSDLIKMSSVRLKLQIKQKASFLNDIDHNQESYWFNIDHLQPLNKAEEIFGLLCYTCILTRLIVTQTSLMLMEISWLELEISTVLDPGLTCWCCYYLCSAGHDFWCRFGFCRSKPFIKVTEFKPGSCSLTSPANWGQKRGDSPLPHSGSNRPDWWGW